jgi:hypothetical protein
MWIVWEGIISTRPNIYSFGITTSLEWINSSPVEEHTFNQLVLVNNK